MPIKITKAIDDQENVAAVKDSDVEQAEIVRNNFSDAFYPMMGLSKAYWTETRGRREGHLEEHNKITTERHSLCIQDYFHSCFKRD